MSSPSCSPRYRYELVGGDTEQEYVYKFERDSNGLREVALRTPIGRLPTEDAAPCAQGRGPSPNLQYQRVSRTSDTQATEMYSIGDQDPRDAQIARLQEMVEDLVRRDNSKQPH